MNWSAIEEHWRRQHLGDLMPHLKLATDTNDFMESVATHPEIVNGSRTDAMVAEGLIMGRLGEEFRSIELLVAAGHGFQALAIACNVFEQAHMLGHVAGDEQRAKDCLNGEIAVTTLRLSPAPRVKP